MTTTVASTASHTSQSPPLGSEPIDAPAPAAEFQADRDEESREAVKRKMVQSPEDNKRVRPSAQPDEDVGDSEAETEVLQDTPKVGSSPRKRARLDVEQTTEEHTTEEQTVNGFKNEILKQQEDVENQDSSNSAAAAADNTESSEENGTSLTVELKPEVAIEAEAEAEDEVDDQDSRASEKDESIMAATTDAEEEGVPNQRKEAISLLTDIEVEFAKVRDTLYDDRMKRFEAEIEMCIDGSHPELADYFQQIAKYRDHKLKLAKFRRDYQLRCIDNQTHAARDQLHQQFMKDKGDSKVLLLLETTREWYKVNRERRSMDSLTPEFSFRPPATRAAQVDAHLAINSEVARLQGLSNYVGFPAAPEMKTANYEELQEDLGAMGIDI